MNDGHVWLGCEAVAQEGDQPVVQLDGHHAAGLLGDQLGEHAGAGADLQHRVLGRELRGGHDMRAVRGVDEEVLAQPLLRANAERGKLGQQALPRLHAQPSSGVWRSHCRTESQSCGTSIVAVSNTTRASMAK